jgi:protein-S-isoprenylcysteine O-methyltransferase
VFESGSGNLMAPAFWATYAAWGLTEVWVFSRDRRRVAGRSADRGSLWAIVVVIVLAIFVAFGARARLPGARIAAGEPYLFWTGIALAWAGLALRLWAVTTLGRFFRTTVVVQDGHELVTRGPYARLRHPAYTGSIATLVGLGLAFGNWISLAAMAVGALLAYAWRIPAEEAALAGRFGEAWAAHKARTWAVVPWVW